MLTSFSDDQALFDSIMAGAAGYVLKQIRGNDLVDAIRRVAAGESLLDPAVTARVLGRLRNPKPDRDPRLARLTPSEERIVEMIAQGLTNRSIGERLHLGEDRKELRVDDPGQAGGRAPRGGGGLLD